MADARGGEAGDGAEAVPPRDLPGARPRPTPGDIITGRPVLRGALRHVLLGMAAVGITYLAGHLTGGGV